MAWWGFAHILDFGFYFPDYILFSKWRYIFKKKNSLLWFCKFLCLVDLMIYFCLNRARPCFETSFKFNRYSMRPFALVRFNNLWIHASSREFNWVSMSKIPSPHFQMESWARCLGGHYFSFRRKFCVVFFNFLLGKFWNSIYLTYIPKCFDKRIRFTFFFISKLCYKCGFFLLNYDLLWLRHYWSYQGQNYQNMPQVFEWKIVTIPFVLLYQFFYMTQPIRLVFLKSLSLS